MFNDKLEKKGFKIGKFNKGVTIISNEVLEYANTYDISFYANEIYKIFVKEKLEKNNIKDLEDIVFVLAHGKSTYKEWKIFGDSNDYVGIKIEEFISWLPKSKTILLYVCNQGGYELKLENYKIIYPNSVTDDINMIFKKLNINI